MTLREIILDSYTGRSYNKKSIYDEGIKKLERSFKCYGYYNEKYFEKHKNLYNINEEDKEFLIHMLKEETGEFQKKVWHAKFSIEDSDTYISEIDKIISFFEKYIKDKSKMEEIRNDIYNYNLYPVYKRISESKELIEKFILIEKEKPYISGCISLGPKGMIYGLSYWKDCLHGEMFLYRDLTYNDVYEIFELYIKYLKEFCDLNGKLSDEEYLNKYIEYSKKMDCILTEVEKYRLKEEEIHDENISFAMLIDREIADVFNKENSKRLKGGDDKYFESDLDFLKYINECNSLTNLKRQNEFEEEKRENELWYKIAKDYCETFNLNFELYKQQKNKKIQHLSFEEVLKKIKLKNKELFK